METEKLKLKLIQVRNILIDLEKYKTDIKYISNKEEDYFETVIQNSEFYYRVYRNSIKLTFIDFYKLLNPKEDFSFFHIINFIISNRNKISWKREIALKQLIEFKKNIENLKNEHLTEIENLRNKHYAHNDKNKHKFNTSIKLSNFWELLETLQKIFIEINLKLNNEQIIFNLWRTEPIEISKNHKFRLIEKMILNELIISPDIGKLQMARDIIQGRKFN